MVKCIYILLIFLLIHWDSKGQLSITMQELPTGIVEKHQLWNLTVLYPGQNPINIHIEMTLMNVEYNQPVFSATSRTFSVSRGINVLRMPDVSPINYNYFSTGLSGLNESFIPIGNYKVCYTIYSNDNHLEGPLAEDCMSLEIQPLSPPLLSMPENSVSIYERYPQFSWIPPTPIFLFNDLNYELLLAEVREDQTPEMAIQENIPLYQARRLQANFNSYPSTAKGLDTGKVYTWRIIAKNGESFAAMSEAWTFRVIANIPGGKVPETVSFIEVKKNNNASNSAIIDKDQLGIKHYSYGKTYEAIIKIFNEKGSLILKEKRTVQYGNNFFLIKLNKKFVENALYMVELNDFEGNRLRSSFRIKSNN